ncbi:MAG: ornithine carbamoyltransferase [Candidatus Omnitrophica bacterium]|nr:ornithine carbamoyltransferase [Candidatus Omnitrophota bacterium]
MLTHFISLKYFSKNEILKLINLSFDIKKNPAKYIDSLKNKSIGLIFEKPSLRTKTAFYIGAVQLGAFPIYYGPEEIRLGKREKNCDVAKTLSKFLDAVVLRTFSHDNLLELARFSTIPVINGLDDLLHPSQVLTDIMTIVELKKDIKNLKVVYIGDGDNVCHSLIYAFSILGGCLYVATPKRYPPNKEIIEEANSYCKISGAKIVISNDPFQVAENADVLYTDVWVSMGKESEAKKRLKIFKNFQINDKILKMASSDCIVMHCLPAHRGEEITDGVIDGEHSVVFLQAENRLYTAKAILYYVLKGFEGINN